MENIQKYIVVGVIVMVSLFVMPILVSAWNIYRRKKREVEEGQIKKIEMMKEVKASFEELSNRGTQIKPKMPEPEIIMDKIVILKRPGPKVYLHQSNRTLIEIMMGKAKIPYIKAKMSNVQYISFKNQPGRKKSRGYWEFTIKYAE